MVSVRWFYKVDEVSIVLPPDTNDREIFFSLCLQHFSVECVDGLAAVLCFEDFDKFQKEPQLRSSSWNPFLCRRQICNDNVKPFDITRVQGYWSQDLLRSMYPSHLKLRLKIKSRSNGSDILRNCNRKSQWNGGRVDVEGVVNDSDKSKSLSAENGLKKRRNLIAPGLEIELLSQDSSIRGCWFRCVVLKRRRDKIKVRYRDVEDADGTGNLEEWALMSRIASKDKLGIRICGRPIVRPSPPKENESLCNYELGEVVDARWHDGWWEGIVIGNVSEGKIRVYFPGEQQTSIFSPGDLRPSQDWVENKWTYIKSRPDIASLLLSELDHEKCSDCINFQSSPSNAQMEAEPRQANGDSSPPARTETHSSQLIKSHPLERIERNSPHLVSSFIHGGLRWSSSRKRTLKGQIEKRFLSNKRLRIDLSHKSSSPFLMPKSLKLVDQENCKSGGDPLFGAPLALCPNLVMT